MDAVYVGIDVSKDRLDAHAEQLRRNAVAAQRPFLVPFNMVGAGKAVEINARGA